MRTRWILVIVSALVLARVLNVDSIQAGEPPPPNQTAQAATPLGTAFTYQGYLKLNGSPVNGTCDCQFTLWDALTAGSALGSPVDKPAIGVTNGLLSIPDLDFGSAFHGGARWLEVAVRCPAGSGSYTTLSPRQELTATPYALYAKTVPFAGSGSANTAARSDHNHWGESWTGGSSSVAGLSVTNSDVGTAGYFKSSGTAIQADGDVQVNGNLNVTGQMSGFPRPSFDSGWVDIGQGATITITHDLGGNPEDYVVDMTFRDYVFGSGIHQISYGGDVRPDEGSKGVWWEALDAASITVVRGVNDARCQSVRIRIWVYR